MVEIFFLHKEEDNDEERKTLSRNHHQGGKPAPGIRTEYIFLLLSSMYGRERKGLPAGAV